MRRALWLLLALAACGEPPPPTEEQLRAREQGEMEKELTTLKARGYFAIRDELAQPLYEFKAGDAKLPRGELSGVLSIAYLLAGRKGLALYEFSDVDPNDVPAERRGLLSMLGGMIYAAHGWPRLSKHAFDQAMPPASDKSAKAEETRRMIEYARVLGPLAGGEMEAGRKAFNSRKAFFDKDPLGGVLSAALSAKSGDYGPAADELLKAVDKSELDDRAKEELRGAAESLRKTKDLKSFAVGLMLRWGAAQRSLIDDDVRNRLAPILEQARKVAGEIFGKLKF